VDSLAAVCLLKSQSNTPSQVENKMLTTGKPTKRAEAIKITVRLCPQRRLRIAHRRAHCFCLLHRGALTGGAGAPCDHWSQQMLHLTVCYEQNGVSRRVLSLSPLLPYWIKP
jgi:hypothetical protein